jgi:hypothetical protein
MSLNFSHERIQRLLALSFPFLSATTYLPWALLSEMVPSLCLINLNFSHERIQRLLAFICPFFSATTYFPWALFNEIVPSLCVIILNFSHARNQRLLAFIFPFFSATTYLPWVVFKATVRTRFGRLRTRFLPSSFRMSAVFSDFSSCAGASEERPPVMRCTATTPCNNAAASAFSRVQLAPSAFSEQLANTPAIVNNITTTPKRAIVKQLN